LRIDQSGLGASPLGCPANEQIPLVPEADIDARLQVVEECDALPYQLDLLDVVELEPERAGGDRGGQRRQRRAFFQDDRL